MKILKQRIAKAFGGGTSKERGTSNLEIVVWISVVLVIAVGLFLLRDNIAKFINNAAIQIAGEESSDNLNQYGFYFDKVYWSIGYDAGLIFREDGSVDTVDKDGNILGSTYIDYDKKTSNKTFYAEQEGQVIKDGYKVTGNTGSHYFYDTYILKDYLVQQGYF